MNCANCGAKLGSLVMLVESIPGPVIEGVEVKGVDMQVIRDPSNDGKPYLCVGRKPVACVTEWMAK